MFSVFKNTKELERMINTFLDNILGAALQFKQGIKFYLNEEFEEFEERMRVVDSLEGKADKLRRDIESKLYSEMLVPEARGDVLALLENSDNVLNIIADTIVEFSVEKPEFPQEFKEDVLNLVEASTKAVEEMIASVRAYFNDLTAVRGHIERLMAFERETDKIGEELKKKIFATKTLRLSNKIHLRTFITYLQSIADKAEDIGDRVSIYTIKRII